MADDLATSVNEGNDHMDDEINELGQVGKPLIRGTVGPEEVWLTQDQWDERAAPDEGTVGPQRPEGH